MNRNSEKILCILIMISCILSMNSWIGFAVERAPLVYDVRDSGAVGDGRTTDTKAFQMAIDQANRAGGATVLVPPGRYLCGTIHLKSHVDFHLMNGATIVGSPDRSDYNADDFCSQNRAFAGDFVSGAHLISAV
ncbi:MAG: glycosyl hydrolase family 28-related protein, partial [Planctomycetia bacterium]|nr:glycosyl hydrolase family 28-related protein [Planctomycetia bacterium]